VLWSLLRALRGEPRSQGADESPSELLRHVGVVPALDLVSNVAAVGPHGLHCQLAADEVVTPMIGVVANVAQTAPVGTAAAWWWWSRSHAPVVGLSACLLR
jgi:hypothetical protein